MNAKYTVNKICCCERGHTLIELVVAISIIGLVSAVIAFSFSEITKVTTSDMAQNIILGQIHQANSWISEDVQSADNITAGAAGNWRCSITRYYWNGSSFTASNIEYLITNADGDGIYWLLRQVNGVSPGTRIAKYLINPGTDTTFSKVTPTQTENSTYLLTLKAGYNNTYFSNTSKIYQRIP